MALESVCVFLTLAMGIRRMIVEYFSITIFHIRNSILRFSLLLLTVTLRFSNCACYVPVSVMEEEKRSVLRFSVFLRIPLPTCEKKLKELNKGT